MKKFLVLVLVLGMAFSFTACGENGGGTKTSPTALVPLATARSLISDIPQEKVDNYIITYNAGYPNASVDANLVSEKTQVGFNGYYYETRDNGVTWLSMQEPCFLVNSEKDYHGSFSAHKLQEDLGEGTPDKVMGRDVMHYTIKNGPMTIDLYVDEENDICLKYKKDYLNESMEMEVTSMEFGVVDQAKIDEIIAIQNQAAAAAE